MYEKPSMTSVCSAASGRYWLPCVNAQETPQIATHMSETSSRKREYWNSSSIQSTHLLK